MLLSAVMVAPPLLPMKLVLPMLSGEVVKRPDAATDEVIFNFFGSRYDAGLILSIVMDRKNRDGVP